MLDFGCGQNWASLRFLVLFILFCGWRRCHLSLEGYLREECNAGTERCMEQASSS